MPGTKVFLVSTDAGGANEVGAIYSRLRDRAHWFRDRELRSQAEVAAALDHDKPGAVICGTSGKEELEHWFFEEAAARKIPSFALIDHWTSFKPRFERGGRLILPDTILVNDQAALDLAGADGLPKEKLRVFGNPYYFDLAQKAHKTEMRVDEREVLFLCDALSEFSDGDPVNEFGISEFIVLESFLNCMKEVKGYRVRLRLHPKERRTKYDELLMRHHDLNVAVDTRPQFLDSVLSHYHVVGMFSAALLESAILGRLPLRVELGKPKRDFLAGSTPAFDRITEIEKLPDALRRYLNRDQKQDVAARPAVATDRSFEKLLNELS